MSLGMIVTNRYAKSSRSVISTDDLVQMYIDARNTERSISNNQAKAIVRKLVAGFHAAGLKRGDCVVLHSFNDVRFSPTTEGCC